VHDVVNILNLIARKHAYPSDIGFKREIEHVWQLWRGPKQEQQQEAG
jgi:hypothetical protein